MHEMVRVLRCGGYLIYNDLTVPTLIAEIGRRLAPVAGYPTESALEGIATAAGLAQAHRARRFAEIEIVWRKGCGSD